MADKDIEIVTSYNNTIPGKAIKLRAAMKFWNRYSGDIYSHVSLSMDTKLNRMMSFARREINNPFNAGLVMEDINSGLFALNSDVSRIAVMNLSITEAQYDKLSSVLTYYWENREQYSFNFIGLASMLLCGRGVAPTNEFFCSQWVSTVLKESGIDIFEGIDSKNIRPFDFYGKLQDNIIYEGLTVEYPNYNSQNSVKILKK
ncbi:MAG: hypothetical protein Q4E39_05350 [bacterium]|nr:hypothetical protein [bacterium]